MHLLSPDLCEWLAQNSVARYYTVGDEFGSSQIEQADTGLSMRGGHALLMANAGCYKQGKHGFFATAASITVRRVMGSTLPSLNMRLIWEVGADVTGLRL